MTASLPELAQNDAAVRAILDDAGIGHRTAARMINEMGPEGEPDLTSEKSVRRYRNKRLSPEAMTSPDPIAGSRAVKGSWQPGIDIDPAQGGEFRTLPRVVSQEAPGPEPEEADLLAEFDLDPKVWEITSARKSLWQSAGGDWLEARKVSFRKRAKATVTTAADVEAIMEPYIFGRSWPAPIVPERERILMIPVGDLQLGKQEGGGTPATIDRFCRIIDDIASEIHVGGLNTSLILPWLGDCIEGIVSQNSRMLTTLDISITEQVRVYRRLMMHQIGILAPLGIKVLIPVVPGNHDETTRVQQMPVNDSWAIEGASAVADWMSGRSEYSHVEFVFPEPGELGITIGVGPVENQAVLSFHHGHVAARPEGIIPWWKGQSHGRLPAGKADMLVTAHFHHLRVEHTGNDRTWLQIPALDGGSQWYQRKTGEGSPAGIISVEVMPGAAKGWRDLTVHV